MSVLIFVSLAVFAAYVLAWGMYRLHTRFPSAPLPALLVRVGVWANRLTAQEGEHRTATFGDLILFVTLWAIGLTLWVTFKQVSGERDNEELGQANTKVLIL